MTALRIRWTISFNLDIHAVSFILCGMHCRHALLVGISKYLINPWFGGLRVILVDDFLCKFFDFTFVIVIYCNDVMFCNVNIL